MIALAFLAVNQSVTAGDRVSVRGRVAESEVRLAPSRVAQSDPTVEPLFVQVAQSDPTAEAILERVAESFRAYSVAEIHFSVVTRSGERGLEEREEGVGYIEGARYRIEVMGMINFSDGYYIYSYNPDVEEITIKNLEDAEEDFLNPNELFNIYKRGFVATSLSDEGGELEIELTPESRNLPFSRLLVKIDKGSYLIKSVTLYGKDGSDIVVEIDSISRPAKSFEHTLFEYSEELYPDIYLIDLR